MKGALSDWLLRLSLIEGFSASPSEHSIFRIAFPFKHSKFEIFFVKKLIERVKTAGQSLFQPEVKNGSPASTSNEQPAPVATTDAKSGDFKSLGLAPHICRAVSEDGYTSPTPIQKAAIPHVIQGRDLLGCAQTGTGKTAAFALPILHRLATDAKQQGPKNFRALILTPTRELAIQIGDSFNAYGRHLGLKTAVIFGGVGADPQRKALRAGVDVLVATPGRLLDLKQQGCVNFSQLQIFVLDEADRMLDMGFIHDVKRIMGFLPAKRQNLLFSATMPREVENLAMSFLKDPAKVEVTPVSSTTDLVSQSVYFVSRGNKRNLLLHIIDHESIVRALIFTRTKSNANRVAEFLGKNGCPAEAIHGNKSQSARQKALENFRSGKICVLVASDIAARGLDIDEISHVINFEMPNIAETYVHRIGRTGRAEARGKAISFCDYEERAYLRTIERVIGKKVPVVEDHPFPETDRPAQAPRENSQPRSGGRPGPRGEQPQEQRRMAAGPRHRRRKRRAPAKV